MSSDKKDLVVFGFGSLASGSLKILVNSYNIKYIITHKDLSDESVDLFCKRNHIDFFYKSPKKNIQMYLDLFKNSRNCILISINYRFIIPKEIYSIFRTAFNIHGSLLPAYRGRAPHVWAIMNGETYAGVTSHIIEEKVDTGDIIIQKKIRIEEEDSGISLIKKYQEIYPTIIIESLEKIDNHDDFIPQNEIKATYYGKRIPEMSYLDLYQSTDKILNFIRALQTPYPNAYYFDKNGNKILIEEVEVIQSKGVEIGRVEEKDEKIFLHGLENIFELTKYHRDNQK